MFPGLPGLPTFPGNVPGAGFLPGDPCATFPDLPGCASPGGPGGTRTGNPPIGITLPPIGGGGGGGGSGSPGGTRTTSGSPTGGISNVSFLSNPLGYLGSTIQASGLRILFFILGLMLIGFGLYFLKETRSIVSVPIKIVKGGIKAAGEAVKTGAAAA